MRPSWKVAGWRIEQLGRGVLPDVAGHDKRAVDARALGVNHPLRDTLPVEVCYLFDELVVLNQNRSSEPCGDGVLVVVDGTAGGCRERFFVFQVSVSSVLCVSS
jgi:hypothetical protein